MALIFHLADSHTNASELSNKFPVICTQQQQMALLSQCKAARSIPPQFYFIFILFKATNRRYHRPIYVDASFKFCAGMGIVLANL